MVYLDVIYAYSLGTNGAKYRLGAQSSWFPV